MRVDWIIGVVVFLMFVVWAFSYYTLLSTQGAVSRSASAMRAADSVIAYMQADSYSMPANITSPAAYSGATVWAYVNRTWDGNSTRVVSSRFSNESLECMISGNILYWTADLSAGANTFYIESADIGSPLTCGASLTPPSGNQTTTWAEEHSPVFSSRGDADFCSMLSSDYGGAKAAAGSAFDFNLLVESDGSSSSCGPPLPATGEVFSFPYSGRLYEGGYVNVTVRLW